MSEPEAPDELLRELQERAKELNCLYRVDAVLESTDRSLAEQLRSLAEALPPGWQHTAACEARVRVGELEAATPGYRETPWSQTAAVKRRGRAIGSVRVVYTRDLPGADEGPFLKEERRLLETVADRIGQSLELRNGHEPAERPAPAEVREDWRVVVDLVRKTDQALYRRLSRRLLNHLSVSGVGEAQGLLAQRFGPDAQPGEENRPQRRRGTEAEADELAGHAFAIAGRRLDRDELMRCLHVWIKEDRVNFLLETLESPHSGLHDIASALERFRHTGVDAGELSLATRTSLKVALIRRLLNDQLEYVELCRRYAEIEDFWELISHTVLLPRSHGRLGGKSSGLFLAWQILRRAQEYAGMLGEVRVPPTWYVPSDGVIQFVGYNDLEDVFNWKFQDIDQIRREYPHLLQVFKSSRFPPEMESGLAAALDDLADGPLIVRSSSLLEDRAGAAFSGKYKSLFLANQGSKAERLAALLDAIAEVYASIFSPDPLQYRAERGLLVHHEEMGIMIQKVVGRRLGRYFAPAFSGVAFSLNERRWSPRLKREDGLLRLVPGLGTRAVDRLSDDYPILVAPGQPGLRVNVTPDEVRHYSPRQVDVINLESDAFETVDREAFLDQAAASLPELPHLVSTWDGETLRRLSPLALPTAGEERVFTFDGLLRTGTFVSQARAVLHLLSETLGRPADLEFAWDGGRFHLLQCRPQSHAPETRPAVIPRDVPPERVLFTARRHVQNGHLTLSHVVFVDPDAYGALGSLQELRDVGRAVARLNQRLPKRRFALMGPGRWGSRGDIRLGVPVGYADINNTAILIEIARARGAWSPDPSFGTHFFQDLVEADIRYLPLYPDEPEAVFDWRFLRESRSALPEMLPEHAALAGVVRVIDVAEAGDGSILEILMNAELDEALALLSPAGEEAAASSYGSPTAEPGPREDHSGWRLRMAEGLARELDPARFGVAGAWVCGSALSASAGPSSDIDLLLHFRGTSEQRRELLAWLDGWSGCLAETNFIRTGHRSGGLLDVRLLSDEEVARRAGDAPGRSLPLGETSPREG